VGVIWQLQALCFKFHKRGSIVNINSIKSRLQLTAAALLLSVAFSSAAIADTGGLQVRVTDADGNPVAGASIHASTSESLTTKSGTTDANGSVRLVGLDPSDDYVVSVTADGFQPQRNENVLVVSERTYNLPFALQSAAGAQIEEIVTYGRSDIGQLVDTTSGLQATDVTLDIMDSLPTGRNYQSYLQMAPTTKPTNSDSGGNPSSKSGMNYTDVPSSAGDSHGSSRDNVYYIDGVNITDNHFGTFGANFNSEIIQEQQIISGGVPAEYEGGQGLISRVISKSGGNEFHGSVNYYSQSDSLVADNDHLNDASFDTYDTAFTIGGPIIKDKLWFFTSFQRKERDEDVIDPTEQTVSRTVNQTEDLGFAKLTWQATENDKLVAQWFGDPTTQNGSLDTGTLNNRSRAFDTGGDNLKFEYSHAWENFILTASYFDHEGEDTRLSADSSAENNVIYTDTSVTNIDTEQGGYGIDVFWDKNKTSANLTGELFLDAGVGSHEIKFGFSDITNEHHLDEFYNGDGSRYNSVGFSDSGATLGDYLASGWEGEKAIFSTDVDRILDAMAASADPSVYVNLYDADLDGEITNAELQAGLVFNSTAGNPNGEVNAVRTLQAVQGAQNFEQNGSALFIQDSWSIDEHWTLDIGFRAEKWDHIASDAKTKVFTFDYEIAPRLSLIYDIKGDGSSKVWGFYGRYYDPIRTNMTEFAGKMTGTVRHEQVYLADTGEWLTYRVRGLGDGAFAPSTKTPYTDEMLLGYERALTENQSISVIYTNRKTRDIFEDYDLGLYTDGCGEFCLPLEYFGFTDGVPAANYYMATLKGGKRDYDGLEFTWRKRRSADSRWFALASYSYNDAQGNSNSDSNADFQGDWIALDPRAPNQYTDQPGNIEHLLKLAGSYRWDNGLEVGATYAWNSGTVYSKTWELYGRHLPEMDAPYEHRGTTDSWVSEGAIGGETTPSYGILNARVKYVLEFGESMDVELFLDMFNVLDNQAATREQDLAVGGDSWDYQEASNWVLPRRLYLGARMSF
jgi:hypothetical protein